MKKSIAIFFIILALSKVNAQDYLISFAGTGDTAVVSSVKVDNLTSGISVTLSGEDILQLVSAVGIRELNTDKRALQIYPNPLTMQSILSFIAPENGSAVISLIDISGRTVYQITPLLSAGSHNFRIAGINQGIYLIKVVGLSYNYSAKLISLGNLKNKAIIEHISSVDNISGSLLKSTSSTIDMPYTQGDQLIYTSTTGRYSTIVADIPNGSKTIIFNSIACSDGVNNNYPVVEIGTQVWMAENLKTINYNDGTPIPLATDSAAWIALTTPAYCWNSNDETTFKNTYGALYNWYTVNTGNLCPVGWHVPGDAEWTLLADYLGGTSVAGVKLKEAGTMHWECTETEPTNESGFSALPGGHRYNYGPFLETGSSGFWWCSSESSATSAWSCRMSCYSDGITIRDDRNKKFGFSVRCMKGDPVPVLPTITTADASFVEQSSATCGGSVTSVGGTAITARGVCWSKSENPTIADNKTSDGTGGGDFTTSITGLAAGTKYYVRAYAINSVGIAYGNQISFFTPSGETVTDINGNIYNTVTIGTQTWMAENLKTTKYNDNLEIPLVEDAAAWSALATPGYCWYGNDEAANKTTYGALYNWHTINTGKLCPAGWHVPTSAEWNILTNFVGGADFAGGKLKESGTSHWYEPNTNATNEFGFTALGSGRRMADGTYSNSDFYKTAGYWWTSTEESTAKAYNRWMSYDNEYVGNYYWDKKEAYSIRCVNDQAVDTSTNVLNHNNAKHTTPNGMLVFKQLINSSLCLYDLKFYSSNLTFDQSTGDITGINGTGKIITFYPVSPIHLSDVNADGIINANDIIMDNLVLEEGQYSLSPDFAAMTFEADFTTSASNTGDYSVYSMVSGTLNVSKSGDLYMIKYEGLDENGLSIKGNFKGKLNVIRNQ